MLTRKEEERRKYLEKVQRQMYLKETYPQKLKSALLISAAKYENEKQIEFQNRLTKHDEEEELKFSKKVKEDAVAEQLEKIEAEKKRRAINTEARKDCFKQ